MSEFTETMHDTAVRLSAGRCGNGCDGCPATLWRDSNGACLIRRIAKIKNAGEQVINLQDWAKEHPEPVYPSWEEGWRQLFPDAKRTPCPDNLGLKNCTHLVCTDCKSSPMPAEVAEKLGIKPIAPEKPPKHDCDTCKFAKHKSTAEPCVRCNHCIDCEESILTAPDLWEEE
nr:MAG TPA: hypothetical protein [Caudoviricetes sp.]